MTYRDLWEVVECHEPPNTLAVQCGADTGCVHGASASGWYTSRRERGASNDGVVHVCGADDWWPIREPCTLLNNLCADSSTVRTR